MGGRPSRHGWRQIFFVVWYRHCPGTHNKKPRSFSFSSSTRRVFFFSQVFTTTNPEKSYFKRMWSSKAAAVAGSSRGHVSAARTDPDTRDPPDSLHFLSQALVSPPFGAFFKSWKKKTKALRRRVSAYFHFSFCSIYQILLCAFVSSCQYAIFLFLFLYLLFTWYCALRCEKYIGKIKISTEYAFKDFPRWSLSGFIAKQNLCQKRFAENDPRSPKKEKRKHF